jgi:hypothetical protein
MTKERGSEDSQRIWLLRIKRMQGFHEACTKKSVTTVRQATHMNNSMPGGGISLFFDSLLLSVGFF